MHFRKLFCVGLLAAIMVSCKQQTATLSQVEFSDNQVYVEGKPFTGVVWSDDHTTWQLTTDNGQVTAFTLYHASGDPAFTMQSPADTLTAYDESGAIIPIDTFAIRYKELAKQIPQLLQTITGENQQP